MKRYPLLLFIVSLSLLVSAQASIDTPPYSPNSYRSPVDHEIKVSGTFGELRADHFHMGLDIKSARGVAGDDIHAAADGYVSKIRVSSRGYGNSIYIDHPDGTRTVYAHLDSYAPAFQRFLDSAHYAQESFELNLGGLSPKQFPIRKGQTLGKMGNTGSSRGVHLHFETRLSANDAAFNPLLYPFPVTDNKAPEIQGLSVYSKLPNGATSLLARPKPLANGSNYQLADTLHVPVGEVGFAVKAYDRQDGTQNMNGVFRIESRANGAVNWMAQYDTIAFEETRYIQAHYDYEGKRNRAGYYYRMHRLPGDKLSIYEVGPRNGFINLGFGESRKMEVSVSDPFGNVSNLSFIVVADLPALQPANESFNYLVPYGRASTIQLADATLELPADAVYTDTYLSASVSDNVADGMYSRCYTIGDANEPIHAFAKLHIPLDAVPMQLRSSAYVAGCSEKDKDNALDATLSTGSTHLIATVETWGDFVLRVDQTKPTIRSLDRYTYLINDDVTSASNLRFRVSQGGKWLLANYDAKRNRLELRRDKMSDGPVLIEVWDRAGNKATR